MNTRDVYQNPNDVPWLCTYLTHHDVPEQELIAQQSKEIVVTIEHLATGRDCLTFAKVMGSVPDVQQLIAYVKGICGKEMCIQLPDGTALTMENAASAVWQKSLIVTPEVSCLVVRVLESLKHSVPSIITEGNIEAVYL